MTNKKKKPVKKFDFDSFLAYIQGKKKTHGRFTTTATKRQTALSKHTKKLTCK